MTRLTVIVFLRFSPLLLLVFFTISLIRFMSADKPFLKDKSFSTEPVMATNLFSGEENCYSLVVKKENLSNPGEIAGFKKPIGEKLLIGRERGNDFVIDSPYASGYHAQIEQCGKDLYIEDLESTNGTYVNGKRIPKKRLLKPGDSILIGGETLEVEGGGADANSSSIPQRAGKRAKRG